jgi:hypothetical protein
MEHRVLVALVGERLASPAVVLAHLRGAVEHLAGWHELVARVVERAERDVEAMVVLGLHVLAHHRRAALAQRLPALLHC